VLRHELSSYRPDLLDRPGLVVGAKADQLSEADWGAEAPVDMAISSVTGQGVRAMLWRLAGMVGEARAAEPVRERYVIHRPEPGGVLVVREDDAAWRVVSREAERAVALSDITNPGALAYAQGRLERLGVNKALRRAGASEGDTVRIGGFAFDYEEDL
jgi:GTP-binding protein